MDNGGRWHHVASDGEIQRVMRDKESEVIECPGVGITFLCSFRFLTILRSGAMGGDVRNIEGGWVYASDLAMRFDLQEMRHLSKVSR